MQCSWRHSYKCFRLLSHSRTKFCHALFDVLQVIVTLTPRGCGRTRKRNVKWPAVGRPSSSWSRSIPASSLSPVRYCMLSWKMLFIDFSTAVKQWGGCRPLVVEWNAIEEPRSSNDSPRLCIVWVLNRINGSWTLFIRWGTKNRWAKPLLLHQLIYAIAWATYSEQIPCLWKTCKFHGHKSTISWFPRILSRNAA